MLVAEEFVGTLDDDAVASRVEREGHLTITADDVDRRRSRFRTTANNGRSIGVVVARELRDGDVLAADGTLIVVSLTPIDAMILDFGGVTGSDTGLVTTALELGHAVGNRHWDLVVEGGCAYLPLADSRERMEATIEPYLPEGVDVRYDAVQPTLFDTGDEPPVGGHGHSHSHDDSHKSHDDGTHAHEGSAHPPHYRTPDSDGGDQP